MQYSREEYEEEQSHLDGAENRGGDKLHFSGKSSELEKFADVTYERVADVLDYLRGKTAEQIRIRLDRLYDEANVEASVFNKQHESLQAEVLLAWSSFARSVERLKSFEAEMLGKSN
jgi:hypothetical protein